ncbi:MAG: hypothetical protein E7607_03765 [Ruminococcaceae bacterium]|nr:hypothetical protein [Oscillospiraceae bacterium]
MKGFVITLISVAFLNGAVGMVSPEGDIKKYVRLAGALCILAAIVSPLYFAINNGNLDFDEGFLDGVLGEEQYESQYESALLAEGESSSAAAIKKTLCRELEMKEGDFDVRVKIGEHDGEYRIEKVEVLLYSSTVNKDPRDISAFVSERTGTECSVIYDIR